MQSVIDFVREIPLTGTAAGIIYVVLLVLGAGVVLWAGWKRWHRTGLTLAVALAAVSAAWFILRHWDIPLYLFAAGLVSVLALVGVAVLPRLRVLLALVAVVSAVSTAGLANMEYGTYPTVASLDPQPVAPVMTLDQVKAASATDGAHGALVTFPVSSAVSGFTSRDATAYLPPAYFTSNATLPVIVLLHGNPGGPEQWFGSGEAAQTADRFQAANGGVSPIVIAVDATGSENANPICANSSVATVMTYLTTDVPNTIKADFRVDADQKHWTVAGLSYGGTCTLQIATTHPSAFGSVIDLSGEAEPTIGTHAATVEKFFGGDESKYQAQNPASLLTAHSYKDSGLAAVFIAGTADEHAKSALTDLSAKARAAGIPAWYGTLEGGHSFDVWRPGLQRAFAWAARRGGLTVTTDPFDGLKDSDVTL